MRLLSRTRAAVGSLRNAHAATADGVIGRLAGREGGLRPMTGGAGGGDFGRWTRVRSSDRPQSPRGASGKSAGGAALGEQWRERVLSGAGRAWTRAQGRRQRRGSWERERAWARARVWARVRVWWGGVEGWWRCKGTDGSEVLTTTLVQSI
ncbi:hypothetical protein BDU57DRAFT_143064 [Ampelomyces quisqualis]|uniref:Uncharacterized protein n=1 Tax=Ampelomyces quisqualis TaxID=50730 RepID=A0A6A5QVP4_AMPQU|nr:hypothetical protein BDU57DRAFT_143064 [Ampelomyces quisqualis]